MALTRTSATGTCSDAAGFTLIELSVVILILSIVLGASLNLFHSGMIGNDFKNNLRGLQALFSQLRYEAVLQNTPQELTIDLDHPGQATYWLSPEPEEGKKKKLLKDAFKLAGLKKDNKPLQTTGLARIRFLPQGLAEPTLFYLRDKNKRHVVQLQAATARLRVRQNQDFRQLQ